MVEQSPLEGNAMLITLVHHVSWYQSSSVLYGLTNLYDQLYSYAFLEHVVPPNTETPWHS